MRPHETHVDDDEDNNEDDDEASTGDRETMTPHNVEEYLQDYTKYGEQFVKKIKTEHPLEKVQK